MAGGVITAALIGGYPIAVGGGSTIHLGLLAGATAGTPGTFPTGWDGAGGTATRNVSGSTQVVDGVECFEVTFSGGTLEITFPGGGYAGVAATSGQTGVLDVYEEVVSGTLTGVSRQIWEINAGFGVVTQPANATAVGGGSLSANFKTLSHTMGGTAAYANAYLYYQATVSTVLRISGKFTVT